MGRLFLYQAPDDGSPGATRSLVATDWYGRPATVPGSRTHPSRRLIFPPSTLLTVFGVPPLLLFFNPAAATAVTGREFVAQVTVTDGGGRFSAAGYLH